MTEKELLKIAERARQIALRSSKDPSAEAFNLQRWIAAVATHMVIQAAIDELRAEAQIAEDAAE